MHLELGAHLRVWDGIFGWKRRREAAATLKHAQAYLTPGTTVLDIGCGMGYVLEVLEEDYGAVAFGCDVVPSTSDIDRFVRFDGNTVPFADKSVDVAMMVFVLHHAEDPALLLREASRVARRAVIVVEDTPRTRFDSMWSRTHIRSFNKRHGIPWRGKSRNDWEWRRLFSENAMSVRAAEPLTRTERLPPVARTVYVLQPAAMPLQAAARAQRGG